MSDSDEDAKPSKSKKTKSNSTESTPTKSAKKSKTSGSDAKSIVLQYLTEQCRPFNVEGLTQNLSTRPGGGIPKSEIQRICDTLVETDSVEVKEFGKSKVYWAKQYDIEDTNEPKRLEAKLTKIQEQTTALKTSTIEPLEHRVKKLQNELTDTELDKAITNLNKQIITLHTKVNDIKSGKQKIISKTEIEKLQTEYNKYYTEWKKRRTMYNELFEMLTQEADKKQKLKLLNDIGIDTDEDHNIKFADYAEYYVKLPSQPEIKKK